MPDTGQPDPSQVNMEVGELDGAFSRFIAGRCSREEVRGVVRQTVERLREDGTSPERVLIVLKDAMQRQLAARSATRPREEVEALAWRLAGWCVDAYFAPLASSAVAERPPL